MDLRLAPTLALALPLAFALNGSARSTTHPTLAPHAADDTVVAWRFAGRAANAHATRDTIMRHGGGASGHVSTTAPVADIVNSGEGRGRGGDGGQRGPRIRPVRFEQTLNAVPYRERRVRVSMWVRTNLPDKPAKGMPVPQAFAFINVDNEDGTVTSYEGNASPLMGATDWTRKVMVIEVPPDAFALSFGVSITGPGDVWVDDVTLEDQAPASGSYAKQPMFPPEMMQRATPEQLEQGKAMLARRVAMMKERPAEVVNGDFETK